MLQGSLDNFGLDEVLGLLADTAKTGRMRITGDRGSGSLWLASGQLIGSEASRADATGSIDETMFELLRFSTGNFSFNSDELPSEPSEAKPVVGVLEAAFERLTQWRAIEAVVPSLAHVITPVSTLPAPEMTITADEWDVLMAIGAGVEVGNVCEHFGLGEVEGSRRVKMLVERSLITISAPPVAVAPSVVEPSAVAPVAIAVKESEPMVESSTAADSDDFGLAPAGLTTDDDMSVSATVGAFDATPVAVPPMPPQAEDRFGAEALGQTPAALPTESGFLDPSERAWNPLSEQQHAEHEASSATHSAPGLEPPAYEPPAYDAAFEADTVAAPAVESTPADAPRVAASAAEANEFSFRPEPTVFGRQDGPFRRASDSVPPPPPAPPAAFEPFEASAPPPPAPPSPADLVASERIDGAEARRLLSGRGTERYDSDPELTEADDDGSLLMQYLRDES